MYAAFRSAWSVFLGIAFLMLAAGLQGSLLGVRAELEGFAKLESGLVMSAFYMGFFVGSIWGPKWIATVGHIRVYAALAALASSSALLHVVVVDPYAWAGMRFVTGCCYAGIYIVSESWLNARATNQTRGGIMGLYMVVSFAALVASQGFLLFDDPKGFALFILTSVMISVAVVPMLLSITPAPSYAAPAPISLLTLYKKSPLGFVGGLFNGLAVGAYLGLGAVFATGAGLDIGRVAIFMSAGYLGGMVLQWPLARLSDRFDRRMILAGSTIAAGCIALLMALMGVAEAKLLYGGVFLYAGFCLSVYSICVAHTNDFLKPEEMIAASAKLYLVVGAGAAAGPLLASVVMDRIGPFGFFWYLAAVHGTLGLFALYRMTRRRAVPLADQGPSYMLGSTMAPVATAVAVESAMASEQQV